MKNVFLRMMLVAAVSLVTSSTQAGCWCWQSWYWEYCTGNSWTDTPGTTVVTTTYGASTSDPKNNGSCTYAGEPAPNKTCQANGGIKQAREWEISGDISAENWGLTGGVSATQGEMIEFELSCGGPVVITGFCQCCNVRARVKFKNTYKCGECYCSLGGVVACSYSYCGTKKEHDGVACDEPGCTVPAGCNPHCPQS